MNSYEALENIKDALVQLPISIVGNHAIASTPQIKIIAELVERDKPKKLNRETTVWFQIIKCPNCKDIFKSDNGEPNFCQNCGQRLDWRE